MVSFFARPRRAARRPLGGAPAASAHERRGLRQRRLGRGRGTLRGTTVSELEPPALLPVARWPPTAGSEPRRRSHLRLCERTRRSLRAADWSRPHAAARLLVATLAEG